MNVSDVNADANADAIFNLFLIDARNGAARGQLLMPGLCCGLSIAQPCSPFAPLAIAAPIHFTVRPSAIRNVASRHRIRGLCH